MRIFEIYLIEIYSLLAVGCYAHYKSKEITSKNVTKHVIEIQTFFQNHHRPLEMLITNKGQMS